MIVILLNVAQAALACGSMVLYLLWRLFFVPQGEKQAPSVNS